MSRPSNGGQTLGKRGRGGPRRGNGTRKQGQQSEVPAAAAALAPASAVDPDAEIASAIGTTRFADIPSMDHRLLGNIPFPTCSEVQAATIPASIAGHDILAQAKTGTGKTLAFLIPAIQHLIAGPLPSRDQTRVLVLSPTRELATQIGVAAEGLVKNFGLGVRTVIGGTNIRSDVKALQTQRVDILIATPGRLVDLLDNEGMGPRFRQLQTLVLDEADRLLDQGFRRELMKILETLPNKSSVDRQTLLFTATIPEGIRQIASIALKSNHQFITTLAEGADNTHAHVTQEYLVVEFEDVLAATVEVLRLEQEKGDLKVMVFLPTARAAGIHHQIFSNLQLPYQTWEIHSRMSQSARDKATEAFRNAKSGVLFSSDVTARGIDVKGVTAVIQVGLPSNEEQYVHRLGRTARAGQEGHGILILGSFESHFLRLPGMKKLPLQPHPPVPDANLQHAKSRLAPALASVSDTSKGQAYQAWLGYYNSSLRALKWDKDTLVQYANQYAQAVLNAEVPALEAKTVGKMGLKGTRGLRIANGAGGGGGRGGGRLGGGARGGGPGGRQPPAGPPGSGQSGMRQAIGQGPARGGASGGAVRGGGQERRRPAASGQSTPA